MKTTPTPTHRKTNRPQAKPKVVCITTGKRYQQQPAPMSATELYWSIRRLRESLEAAWGLAAPQR